MKIWAVCKDLGGMAGLLPVVEKLEHCGHSVRFIANGISVGTLRKKGRVFEEWTDSPTEDLASKGEIPDVFITSMCSQGGPGRDLVPLMRALGVPVIALQDFWVSASSQADAWLDIKYRPDRVITNDQVGKDLLAQVWPDFDREHIVITGFPALDKYAAMDFAAIRERARDKLGIDPRLPIILFAGGGSLTYLAHQIIKGALTILSCHHCFGYLPRPHPRTENDFPGEMNPWQKTVGEIAAESGITVIYDFFGRCDPTETVAASEVICSISSTLLLDAAIMRKPTISVMPPGLVKNRFRYQMNGFIDQYPLVPLGCCLEATTAKDLAEQIKQCLETNPLRTAQERHLKLDGQNAARVVKLIESLKP